MMVTLISYLIFQKISSRFWLTIITQHTTIIDLKALLFFHTVFYFDSQSTTIQPKYWHSFMSRILFSSEEMKRLMPNMMSQRYQKSEWDSSQVRLKMKSEMGVTNLEKTLLESTFISSFIPLFENQFRKRPMMSMKCMATMKAWRFWLSMTILTRRTEMLTMQRQERQRMQLMTGERWRGSYSQQQRQVRSSLSNSRKKRQYSSMRVWQLLDWSTEQKRQRQQAKSSHSKTSIWQTLLDLRGLLLVRMDRYWLEEGSWRLPCICYQFIITASNLF